MNYLRNCNPIVVKFGWFNHTVGLLADEYNKYVLATFALTRIQFSKVSCVNMWSRQSVAAAALEEFRDYLEKLRQKSDLASRK